MHDFEGWEFSPTSMEIGRGDGYNYYAIRSDLALRMYVRVHDDGCFVMVTQRDIASQRPTTIHPSVHFERAELRHHLLRVLCIHSADPLV
jgi:hypothetical protein